MTSSSSSSHSENLVDSTEPEGSMTLQESIDDLYNRSFPDVAPADVPTIADPPEGTTDPSTLDEGLDDLHEAIEDELDAMNTGDPSATPDVIGNPSDASYSEDTATTGPSTGDTTGVDETGNGGPTTNDIIGVNGVVTYISPRDVDGDGQVDLVHSVVDGISTTTHYGADGTIALVEQDIDGNGTFEAAVSLDSDGTLREADDTDDDGDIDLVTNTDAVTGAPLRQETVVDGQVTEVVLDSTGTGAAPDVHLYDTDGDGYLDTAKLDTDGDQITNQTLIDTNGDGRFDVSTIDADNNGSEETIVTQRDADLGTTEVYEDMIPADDSYHTQTEWPAEPSVDPSYDDNL